MVFVVVEIIKIKRNRGKKISGQNRKEREILAFVVAKIAR